VNPRNAWRVAVFAAAPALLLLVATHHVYQVQANGLTPWKGGGFGMFATLDVRFIRCRLVGEAGERPTRIPPEAKELAAAVREVPTRDRLRDLAQAVARRLERSAARRPVQSPPRDLRVEVWRAAFDSDRSELRAVKIAEETLDR
jgi:hypothetical protein